MTGFLQKIFRRRFSLNISKERQPSSVPEPSLLRPTGDNEGEYDYVCFSPVVERIERQYVYTSVRLTEAKNELKKLEDAQIKAVLEGSADDSFFFHVSYDELRNRVKELEFQRRSLRRRVQRARRDLPEENLPKTVKYYPPL